MNIAAQEVSDQSVADSKFISTREEMEELIKSKARLLDYTYKMGLDLSGLVAKNVDFSGLSLPFVSLEDATLDDCDFVDAFLGGSNMRGISAKGGDWAGCDFERGDLTFSFLEMVRLEGALFKNTTLTKTKFKRCHSPRANFNGAKMAECILESASYHKSSFVNADLSKTDLLGDFSEANFDGATMANSDMQCSMFTKSSMQGVDMSGTNFANADFTLAKIRNSSMKDADFTKSCLQDTMMVNSNAQGAKFKAAFTRSGRGVWLVNVMGADFSDAHEDLKVDNTRTK